MRGIHASYILLALGLFCVQVIAFVPSRHFIVGASPLQRFSLQSFIPQVRFQTHIAGTNVSIPSIDNFTTTKVDNQVLGLLDDAITYKPSAASVLLSEIEKMRQNSTSPFVLESFLNDILSNGPDSKLPFWTRSKRLARYSRRARLASLRRLLDMTVTPSDDDQESSESLARRRRRALVMILRSLEQNVTALKTPAIIKLEKRAIQAAKEEIKDLRNRLPPGLETPNYDILDTAVSGQKNIEVRLYKPYSVCAVSMNKPRPIDSSTTDATITNPEIKGASSFGALAGYLFGKNDQSKAMKMTTPVLTFSNPNGEKQMAFVMPSQFWDGKKLQAAPKPILGSEVELQQMASEQRAVLMFGGFASKKEVERRKKQLLVAVSKDIAWEAVNEDVTVAQYNDPFTVPWRRLNEISVQVKSA